MTRGAYDYEEAFNLPLEQAQDKDIERLLHAGKLKSVYATKTIKSGDQFEIEIFPDFTKKQAHDLKLKKPSRQAQKNLNDKNARKKLERLINANFSEGDYWITLTYSNASLPKDMQEALKNMNKPFCKVLRDGEVVKVKSEELVVGDMVVLEAGDIVPADLRLIEAMSLKVEEAALTGESVPSEKDSEVICDPDAALGDRKNMVYSSGVVSYGRGKGVVVATGMKTEVGKIAKMLSEHKE